MKKSPYTTDIIPLVVAAATSSGFASQTIESGQVVGVALITKGGANTGMVRVKITDTANNEIVKLQPIEMLALRPGNFHDGFYPLNFTAKGQNIKFEIIADANFTTILNADLVFIYDVRSDC